MRRFLIVLLAAAFVGLVSGAVPVAANDDGEVEAEFKISLSGAEEVPPNTTAAFGIAEVELKDLTLRFEVEVCGISGVTQSHIHVGAAGTNGPVVLFLYGFDPSGSFSADDCERLSTGILTPADLMPQPDIGINTWDDFVAALLSGNTYVNVHTLALPGGEIRGQLD